MALADSEPKDKASAPTKDKASDVEISLTLLDTTKSDHQVAAQKLGIEKATCRMRRWALGVAHGDGGTGPAPGGAGVVAAPPPVLPAGADVGPATSMRSATDFMAYRLAQVLDPAHANMDINGLLYLVNMNRTGADDDLFAWMLPARTSVDWRSGRPDANRSAHVGPALRSVIGHLCGTQTPVGGTVCLSTAVLFMFWMLPSPLFSGTRPVRVSAIRPVATSELYRSKQVFRYRPNAEDADVEETKMSDLADMEGMN
ncbi:hypothetical protein PENVUL_c002G00145 [Penicillium vulpinum]|uniref:Uncharacterized protein n=1 Tax=Penicillium vulpinum TaxID=29845 RepID=A0A1V6SCF6_9EURO|nr:hypothetical protein PENVUL_c002G00145 [Penicillium vulpinum]